jgi:PST family polysaccharide transporter
MIGGLIAVTAGFLVQFEFLADVSPLLRIFVSGMVCLLTYLAVVAGIFRITAPLQLAFSVLHDLRGFRTPAGSRP